MNLGSIANGYEHPVELVEEISKFMTPVLDCARAW